MASAAAGSAAGLTNLAHLDFLGAVVTPPPAAGHVAYGNEPVGVLWTYADHRDDGSYARVGGGAYDPATNTYGQGAFNADDIARAAVVYLRHYQLRRDSHSLAAARGLLRGLTFLQTAEGPHAGNVVLWMQPDGTLNPSADPPELPDPSDSGPAYWLARTVWALGEGYAVFRTVDVRFAAFLRSRLELAIAALERQVLVRYGQWNVVDGRRVPAWLIVAGADATSEAVLGLSAYVRCGGSPRARKALAQFASGVAAMGAGDTRTWPFRALLPWGESVSDWHAWGAQMPSALAAAATALGDRSLLGPAIGDAAGFTPLLLTAGGPDNGWLPVPIDRTQIAYGVDARVQGLLGVARAAGRPGLRQVAAFAAAWYFGANRAGEPTYDPATGRTFDGVSGDGVINRNSGAESTIHGLLSMLALDEHPDVARLARDLGDGERTLSGLAWVEAEAAALAGGGVVVTPSSAWTGESQWSNGSYVSLPPAARASWTVSGAAQPRLVLPVVNLLPGAGSTEWKAGSVALGAVDHGKVGPQGVSAAPGALLPVTLGGVLPAGATSFTAVANGPSVQIDAVLLLPMISSLSLGRGLLLASVDAHARSVDLPRAATFASYDSSGRLHSRQYGARAVVLPGGFTVVG
ncbi:hypothetical protein [Kribbella voronezhensis]|uniref:hypothetical protein n=1 Tax=Kribbella voronezhensis TaxID=2512212 RepID=UPI001EDE71C8|nr:hypothetical protein [Kribbella voronezhensis]